jgi:predicted O-methyltransferase YrrM
MDDSAGCYRRELQEDFWSLVKRQIRNLGIDASKFPKEKTVSSAIKEFPFLLALLQKHIDDQKIDNIVCAEVGCWKGATTLKLLPTIRKANGRIYCIDWFQGSVAGGAGEHGHRPENSNQVRIDCETTLAEYKKEVIILEGDSAECAKFIPDCFLDFCFIDAGHRYSNCIKDIEAYWPKVKTGGLICGHDYAHENLENIGDQNVFEDDTRHLGVTKAVKEFFGDDFSLEMIAGQNYDTINQSFIEPVLTFNPENSLWWKRKGITNLTFIV